MKPALKKTRRENISAFFQWRVKVAGEEVHQVLGKLPGAVKTVKLVQVSMADQRLSEKLYPAGIKGTNCL